MARPNKIWFRRDTGWWMVTFGGKKIRLAEGRENREQAEHKFAEIKALALRSVECGDARVADIIDRFLSWSKIHRSAETNRNFIWFGQQFCEHIGYLPATALRPHHMTTWVDSRAWGPTTQRNARRSVYRAFSWATEEGLLISNPLQGMKCPAALARPRAMSDCEFRSLLKGSTRDFKVLLFALRMTGCRPKEARTLTWDQVFEDRWVLEQHKTSAKTHRPRVIYLIPSVRRLMTVLRREHRRRGENETHVFLNERAVPWTMNAVRLRIQRLKKKANLSSDLCAYMARHAFGTSAVLNGVDLVTVAQLMGHTSLEMIQRVYVHLGGEHQHLNKAAEQATKFPDSSRPAPIGQDPVV